MRTIEASGKSVDEAIFNGLRELEISIDEVEIEIIQTETKGVLGIGAKPARVRLIEREADFFVPDYEKDSNDSHEKAAESRPPRENQPPRPREPQRPREQREPREQRAPREQREQRPSNGDARRSEGGGRNRHDRGGRRRPFEDNAGVPEAIRRPKVEYSAEAAADMPAADFVKGLMDRMGAEANVLAATEADTLYIRIDSPAIGVLIGHRGETLDALQYLTSLVANKNRKEQGYMRVTLDTEGYREKREETLSRLARRIAGQVKASDQPRTLEPMNPSERRVLHATLQNNPYVVTYSEGEEPNRHVVIAPKHKEDELVK